MRVLLLKRRGLGLRLTIWQMAPVRGLQAFVASIMPLHDLNHLQNALPENSKQLVDHLLVDFFLFRELYVRG